MKIGYARVSTKEQNLDRQIDALKIAGCTKIYREKVSGADIINRPQLKKALKTLTKEDIFIVAEWDRATRSFEDGFNIMTEIIKKEALLTVLDKPDLSIDTPMGKAFLGFYSAMAEEGRQRRQKTANEGIKAAKARGKRLGRKPKLDMNQKREALTMLGEGKSTQQIANIYRVSKATIQRLKSPLT